MSAAVTIHVSNLPFTVTEGDLRALFAEHGSVLSVSLPVDLATGQPRGFGFVQLSAQGAEAAVAALDGYTLQGRNLRLSPAQTHQRQGGGPYRR